MSANAAQIGAGDFTNPTVFDYEGLGLPAGNATPIIIGTDTYTTFSGILRYVSFCAVGFCVGSHFELDYIDIVLNTPVWRAGGFVNGSSGDVQFFNESDALLGTVAVTTGEFSGWQADAGLIRRIRITDTESNSLIITFDNLTTEQRQSPTSVPTMTEWGMMIFMVIVGIGSVYYLKRQIRA